MWLSVVSQTVQSDQLKKNSAALLPIFFSSFKEFLKGRSVWDKPTGKARVGQVFTDPPKLCWQDNHSSINLWNVFCELLSTMQCFKLSVTCNYLSLMAINNFFTNKSVKIICGICCLDDRQHISVKSCKHWRPGQEKPLIFALTV